MPSDHFDYEEYGPRGPEPPPRANGHDREPDLVCAGLPPCDIAEIPPRQWAYGHFLLFGHASAIGAVDGGGKGALAVVMALAIITGRPLLGERVWRRGPVAVVTYEDDETEWQRRIAAACLHYGIAYKEALAGFRFIKRPVGRVRFAALGRDHVVFPDGETIIRHLKSMGAALLIVDPFNHSHDLGDGNSNALIAQVAGEMSRLAAESGAAVLVLHHLRKGATGSADDLMGATALRATFRSARILARMTEAEADRVGVPHGEAWRYLRIAATKENYAPPPQQATWLRLESVDLGNGTADYPAGDNMQVAVSWSAPDTFDGLSYEVLNCILDEIERGMPNGQRYSAASAARERAAWAVVQRHAPAKNEAQGRDIIGAWLRSGLLFTESYDDPVERKSRVGLRVDAAKRPGPRA